MSSSKSRLASVVYADQKAWGIGLKPSSIFQDGKSKESSIALKAEAITKRLRIDMSLQDGQNSQDHCPRILPKPSSPCNYPIMRTRHLTERSQCNPWSL